MRNYDWIATGLRLDCDLLAIKLQWDIKRGQLSQDSLNAAVLSKLAKMRTVSLCRHRCNRQGRTGKELLPVRPKVLV